MTVPSGVKRVLIKVSGEAMMGEHGFGIDPAVAKRIARDVADARALGISLGIVCGGGNIARGVTLSEGGSDRVIGDQIGMLATVMNGLALRDAFLGMGVPSVVFSAVPVPSICETFSHRDAEAAFSDGKVAIFVGGTGNPFFTTDSAAALRAAEMKCDLLLKATKVDGIYTADPMKDPNATRFDRLTHSEAIERGLKVMDTAALALARENGIPILVFSIYEVGAITTVLRGQGHATLVAESFAQ